MTDRQRIEQYAKERFGSPSGGLTHTKRVYIAAQKLSTEFDDEILHAACYLHDINLDKPHPNQAAIEARTFLESIQVPEDKLKAVIHAIEEHGFYGNPDSKEGFMLFDSDQLDSMGVTGFIQFSEFDSDPAIIEQMLKNVETEAMSILRLKKSKDIGKQKIENRKAIISLLKSELS